MAQALNKADDFIQISWLLKVFLVFMMELGD